MVDVIDREAAAALTNSVIPVYTSEENPNHGEITTLAIHDDDGRRSNECRVWGQTMTGSIKRPNMGCGGAYWGIVPQAISV